MIIYKIEHKESGKVYIGQTVRSLAKRISRHQHDGYPIGQALRKYGLGAFDVKEIDSASTLEQLNILEEAWIASLNCIAPNGYNLRSGGGNSLHSDSSKQKMSEAARNMSPETKAKMSNWQKGRKLTPEHRANIGAAGRGNKRSQETKDKQSAAARNISEETRAKRSESMKKYWATRKEEDRGGGR